MLFQPYIPVFGKVLEYYANFDYIAVSTEVLENKKD